jgi:hypothetical protein
MAAVDQARIGLLVPGWAPGRGRSLRSTPVVDDVPEAGEFVGHTIDQVAAARGVRKEAAREALLEGRLPAPQNRGRKLPPQLRAWIDEHFGPGLSFRDVVKKQRMSGKSIRELAASGQPPPPPGLGRKKRAKDRKPGNKQRPLAMDQVLHRMLSTPPQPKKASPKKREASTPKARKERKPARELPPPQGMPAMTTAARERLRSAFLAELRARAPVAARMTRIFQAEIRI